MHQTIPQPKTISIEKLLEWAFGAEKAELEQRSDRSVPIPHHLGFRSFQDALLQLAVLGVRVDTSASGATFIAGESPHVHWDAEAVAAVVAGVLDRRLAQMVYHFAQAGTRPSWMPGAVPKLVPRPRPETPHDLESGWFQNRHGRTGRTEKVGEIRYQNERGRWATYESRVCPVTWWPTHQQIETTRGSYLAWWNALHRIHGALSEGRVLKSHRLTGEMPPAMPWVAAGEGPAFVETGPQPAWRA